MNALDKLLQDFPVCTFTSDTKAKCLDCGKSYTQMHRNLYNNYVLCKPCFTTRYAPERGKNYV